MSEGMARVKKWHPKTMTNSYAWIFRVPRGAYRSRSASAAGSCVERRPGSYPMAACATAMIKANSGVTALTTTPAMEQMKPTVAGMSLR